MTRIDDVVVVICFPDEVPGMLAQLRKEWGVTQVHYEQWPMQFPGAVIIIGAVGKVERIVPLKPQPPG